jgi:hypothetical protein
LALKYHFKRKSSNRIAPIYNNVFPLNKEDAVDPTDETTFVAVPNKDPTEFVTLLNKLLDDETTEVIGEAIFWIVDIGFVIF